MANSNQTAFGQERFDAETEMEFVGADNMATDTAFSREIVDTRIERKAISMSSIDAMPQRCTIAKRRVILARITGIVDGTMDFETDDKPPKTLYGLTGEFEADVYADDYPTIIATYYSGICFLPDGPHQRMLAMARRLKDNAQMTFDIQCAADPVTEGRAPYHYVFRSLQPRETNTALDRAKAIGSRLANHPDAAKLVHNAPPLIEGTATRVTDAA